MTYYDDVINRDAHLIRVKKCVNKQRIVVPKLLLVGQRSKNLRPKRSRRRGGGGRLPKVTKYSTLG